MSAMPELDPRERTAQLDFERGRMDALAGRPPADGTKAYLAGFIDGVEKRRVNGAGKVNQERGDPRFWL